MRTVRRRWLSAAVVLVCTAGVAATTVAPSAAVVRPTAPGGVLRLAAEQEPYCADWLGSCAAVSWGNWVLGNETLPKAFRVDPDGNYVPGAVLAGEPTVDPGPPMTVTYRINPAAVWSDGAPITAKDFEYVWEQVTTGKNIWDTTGYDDITAIDTTDPKTAVVTFRAPYAGWKDLFGGFYYLLPSHLLEGKDRHAAMKDGYGFSGGPWMLDGGASGWKQGKTITLVPNPRYWDTKPQIGKVVFQFVTETPAETKALATRQVLAAYPQPHTGMLDELDDAGLEYQVSSGNQYEGLWLNSAQWPLDSKAVRQALLYATDRQAIVDQIVKPSVRQGRVLQSFIVPSFAQYYAPAFTEYSHNLEKVDELMKGDGWAKDSDGTWAKDGRRATVPLSTTAGNASRALTQQLWESQLQQAGFDVKTTNASADLLFGKLVPRGQFGVALYAQVGTPDPGLCVVFCSQNIPSKKNGYVGQNYTRLASDAIDRPWKAVDQQLDTAQRASSAKQGQTALADEAVSIPLFQLPTVFAYDGRRIDGPLRDNTVEGPFWNLERWSLK